MPAAKSMRPGQRRSDAPANAVSGEKVVGTASHADFLDAVTRGTCRLLGEEKRRSGAQLEPGIRRVQYGVATGERVVLIRWAEDNAGNWHKTELNLPKSAVKALVALVTR
jgi:hypothetical protein